MSWKNEIEELRKRKEKALNLGGEEKIRRQHKSNTCVNN